MKDDADLKLIDCYKQPSHLGWLALHVSNGGNPYSKYLLRHRATNKCADKGNGVRQGVPLKIWDCNRGNKNQQFQFRWKFIVNAQSGLCYVDEGGNGVRGWGCESSRSNAMVWNIERTAHGSVIRANRHTKRCLQVETSGNQAKSKNGSKIRSASCLGNWNQQWFAEPAG